MFGIELAALKKKNIIVRAAASKQLNKSPWLCYKYIPSFDGPPDANYPTIVWFDVKIDQLWLGKEGSLLFGEASADDVSVGSRIVDALRSLPVLEVSLAMRMTGSVVLRNDKSRRLK